MFAVLLATTCVAHAEPTWGEAVAAPLGLAVEDDGIYPSLWAHLRGAEDRHHVLIKDGPDTFLISDMRAWELGVAGGDTALKMTARGNHGLVAERTVAVQDGELVMLRETIRARSYAYDIDWVTMRQVSQPVYTQEPSPPAVVVRDAAVVVAGRGDPGLVWIHNGTRRSLADANVQVSAEASGDVIALTVRGVDDHRVPVSPQASSTDFMAADHIGLWTAFTENGVETPILLGIAWDEDGQPHARWLEGERPSVPKVVGDGVETVTIFLTAEHLDNGLWGDAPASYWEAGSRWEEVVLEMASGDASAWTMGAYASWPLTVFFADADHEPGTDLTVATSDMEMSEPESFGRLVVLPTPGGAGYPAVPGAVRLK